MARGGAVPPASDNFNNAATIAKIQWNNLKFVFAHRVETHYNHISNDQDAMKHFLALALLAVSASASTAGKESPAWLAHVNDDIVNNHLKFAEERHLQAIQTALEYYPTNENLPSAELIEKNKQFLSNLKFDKFRITAHGKLPDFHDELGTAPVFVTRRETPLFTKEECKDVIEMAESHFQDTEWPKLPSGQYYIQGFWIKDVPSVRQWFVEMCQARLFPLLKQQFPDFADEVEDLVVDQAYLFKYIPNPGLRTEIHTDAGCLSFTFSLNSKDEYKGGGTWVEGLEAIDGNANTPEGNVIEMDVGQCTVRPGGIRHCGNPLTEGTRYIIGGFCMSKKRVEPVRQLLQSEKEGLEVAVKLNPEFDGAYPGLAHCYETEGNKEKAIAVLEDCLRLANPRSTTASYYLGTTYYKQGKYDKARECMMTCLDVDPTDGDAMGTLAQVHAKLGQHQEEHELYQKIISTPGVPSRILSNAFCNLGTMHEGTQVEMEYYQKSLEHEPSNIGALQSLGSVYASQKQWDDAIRCYRQAAELSDKEDAELLTLLYRAATQQLRTETTAEQQQNREAMMERLGELMGKENMDRLMSLQKR